MIFFNGSDKTPPLGCIPSFTEIFNEENTYPKASFHMCSKFAEKISFGIKNNGGFRLL